VLIQALRIRGLLKSGAQAQGTVVGAERDTSHRHDGTISTTYNPVVRFTTADGRTVRLTSGVGYSYNPHIGRAVPIRYRPDDPEQAEIDRAAMWMLPAAVRLGLLVAGVIVYSTSASPAAASTAANSTAPSASQPANSSAGISSPAPSPSSMPSCETPTTTPGTATPSWP
jgi:Protein of unknown function (DUF3592)